MVSLKKNSDKSFLGTGWSFPPTFQIDGVEMVSDDTDIAQSLEILMSTSLGERIMLPDYGCDLRAYLFDSINNSKIYFLKELVTTAIIKYEPRVVLNDVIIDATGYQDGLIKIQIDYSVQTSNTRFNLVFPYYRVEGTDIPQLFHKQVTLSQKSEDDI